MDDGLIILALGICGTGLAWIAARKSNGPRSDDKTIALLGPFYFGLFSLGLAAWGLVLIVLALSAGAT